MVTERIILAIVDALNDRACTTHSGPVLRAPAEPSMPAADAVKHANALPTNDLYDALLVSYDVPSIQGAILWMKLRGYLSAFGWGSVEMGYQLTEKGIALSRSRLVPQEDLKRLSAKAISVRPAIYGVSLDPKELWWRVKKVFRKVRGG